MELMDSGAGACPPVSVSSTLHSVLQINAVQAISVNFILQHHNLRDAQLQLSAYIYVSLFRFLGHHWCSSPSFAGNQMACRQRQGWVKGYCSAVYILAIKILLWFLAHVQCAPIFEGRRRLKFPLLWLCQPLLQMKMLLLTTAVNTHQKVCLISLKSICKHSMDIYQHASHQVMWTLTALRHHGIHQESGF